LRPIKAQHSFSDSITSDSSSQEQQGQSQHDLRSFIRSIASSSSSIGGSDPEEHTLPPELPRLDENQARPRPRTP